MGWHVQGEQPGRPLGQRRPQAPAPLPASTAPHLPPYQTAHDPPTRPQGCLLNDVVNSNAKFTDLFDGPPKNSGLT